MMLRPSYSDGSDVDDDYSHDVSNHNNESSVVKPTREKPPTTMMTCTVSSSSSSSNSSSSSPSPHSSIRISTIALLGTSPTAHAFCQAALNAGYRVRLLIEPDCHSMDSLINSSPNLHAILGYSQDVSKLERLLHHAEYVVCMLNTALHAVLQQLYPIMMQVPSLQLFLFQSNSLAPDLNNRVPILSRCLRTLARIQTHRSKQIQDHAEAIRFIVQQHTTTRLLQPLSPPPPPHFGFLITRPTIWVKEGPSTKHVAASKSQPGLGSLSHNDVAELTLQALVQTKLYNTSPYIVSTKVLP